MSSGESSDDIDRFLALVNTYPSPHNGQPMVLTGKGGQFTVWFETERGLTATPISYHFSFVTIGVFFRHLEACADAVGFAHRTEISLPAIDDMSTDGTLRCGTFALTERKSPNEPLKTALLFRQTSRRNYSSGLDEATKIDMQRVASNSDLEMTFLSDEKAHQAIWLNQRAVFDDMFDPKVRTELAHWLRFSHEEKITKQDGLSYDCMQLSGSAMRFSIDHYQVLRWPIIAPLLRSYYLRTMKDHSTVGYLQSPFETPYDTYEIGRVIAESWLLLSQKGLYLHPFGTIVSNDDAHADFTSLAGIVDETREKNYVVFIFRAGASEPPVRSARLPWKQHLYKEGEV